MRNLWSLSFGPFLLVVTACGGEIGEAKKNPPPPAETSSSDAPPASPNPEFRPPNLQPVAEVEAAILRAALVGEVNAIEQKLEVLGVLFVEKAGKVTLQIPPPYEPAQGVLGKSFPQDELLKQLSGLADVAKVLDLANSENAAELLALQKIEAVRAQFMVPRVFAVAGLGKRVSEKAQFLKFVNLERPNLALWDTQSPTFQFVKNMDVLSELEKVWFCHSELELLKRSFLAGYSQDILLKSIELRDQLFRKEIREQSRIYETQREFFNEVILQRVLRGPQISLVKALIEDLKKSEPEKPFDIVMLETANKKNADQTLSKLESDMLRVMDKAMKELGLNWAQDEVSGVWIEATELSQARVKNPKFQVILDTAQKVVKLLGEFYKQADQNLQKSLGRPVREVDTQVAKKVDVFLAL